MGFVKKAKSFLCKFDLFSQPVGLRIRQQPHYQTATGGICSIIVIIVFISVFSGTTILTFQKAYISFTQVQFQETTPSFLQTNIDTDFMFAVGITGINMNQGQRYFDISLQFREYTNFGKNQKKVTLILQKCSRQQWTQIGEQFGKIYDSLGFEKWLCPPNNMTLQLQGKYTSQIFKFYRIVVSKCNSSLNNLTGRACVNQTIIDSYLNIEQAYNFNFYFVNKLLNPGNQTFVQYFMDDSNYFPFSKNTGVNADIFVNSFKFITDESIFPIEDLQEVSGGLVRSISQKYSYGVKGLNYLKLYIRKATISYQYTRSYRKADDTISYIGGLFSSIMAALFIIGMYSEVAYQIQLARVLIVDNQRKKLNSNDFHFFNYLCYTIYSLFMAISIELHWPKTKIYYQMLEQIRKQLDVRLIMKRLQYVEDVSKLNLQEHKIKAFHLKSSKTIQDNQKLRQQYNYPKAINIQLKTEEQKSVHTNRPNNTTQLKLQLAEISFQQNTRQKNNIIVSNGQQKVIPISKDGQLQYQNHLKQRTRNKLDELKSYIHLLEEQMKQGDKISEKILQNINQEIKEKIKQKNPSHNQNHDHNQNQNQNQVIFDFNQ